MSSYLNIYLVPKRKDKTKDKKQYLLLASCSRNSDVYELFYTNINPTFIGNRKEANYTILTMVDMQDMIDDICSDIKASQERLEVYEQYASKNEEYIQEILNIREILRDYKSSYEYINFIKNIVEDTIGGFNDFEEVCCNID